MKRYNVTVNGTTYVVDVEEVGFAPAAPASAPSPVAAAPAPQPAPSPAAASTPAPKAAPSVSGTAGNIKITSPMPGTILAVNVKPGQSVKKGETVCVLEAMKMENAIPAPEDGTVASVDVQKGASVSAGDTLITLN